MKKLNEHYYAISKDEITKEMEYVGDGLYLIGEDFYEICDDAEAESITTAKTVARQQTPNKQVVSTVSTNKTTNSTIYFVFSVLFLAFSVLCFYLSINNFVVYGNINDANYQLGGMLNSNATDSLVRDGLLWLLGGIASIIIGIVSSVTYNNKKQ